MGRLLQGDLPLLAYNGPLSATERWRHDESEVEGRYPTAG